MDFSWADVFSVGLALFLLLDPIGNVPVFIAVLKNAPQKNHKKIILRELCIALMIIILFQFIGNALLNLLKVSNSTVLISGGVILFLIAIRMVFPHSEESKGPKASVKDPFIVPLAVPLIAGPAILAAVMLYAGQTTSYSNVSVTLAIVFAWGVSTLILLTAPFWKRVLGDKGLLACEKLMGLILTLLAVQMLLEGVALFITTGR